MSIETKANVEYHVGYIANGLAGLRLKRDYEDLKTSPELEQFKNYLKGVKQITLPSRFASIQSTINDALKNVKESIEQEDKIDYTIIEAEKLCHYLQTVHEEI